MLPRIVRSLNRNYLRHFRLFATVSSNHALNSRSQDVLCNNSAEFVDALLHRLLDAHVHLEGVVRVLPVQRLERPHFGARLVGPGFAVNVRLGACLALAAGDVLGFQRDKVGQALECLQLVVVERHRQTGDFLVLGGVVHNVQDLDYLSENFHRIHFVNVTASPALKGFAHFGPSGIGFEQVRGFVKAHPDCFDAFSADICIDVIDNLEEFWVVQAYAKWSARRVRDVDNMRKPDSHPSHQHPRVGAAVNDNLAVIQSGVGSLELLDKVGDILQGLLHLQIFVLFNRKVLPERQTFPIVPMLGLDEHAMVIPGQFG
uniref:Uncharacterized protein n=1 Tax=Photinus pyralis TaxID=7054 RepID=A0A1Y1M3C9_PHOPY